MPYKKNNNRKSGRNINVKGKPMKLKQLVPKKYIDPVLDQDELQFNVSEEIEEHIKPKDIFTDYPVNVKQQNKLKRKEERKKLKTKI